MTDQQHPITPPPELVEKWYDAIDKLSTSWKQLSTSWKQQLATRAAQWGADQELEACCEWLKSEGYSGTVIELRDRRRPKPPSLKEQALLQLDTLNADLAMHGRGCDLSQIRRALEALPSDH